MIDTLIGFGIGFLLGGFAGVCLAAVVAMAGGGDE
jgi:hypothetical protein